MDKTVLKIFKARPEITFGFITVFIGLIGLSGWLSDFLVLASISPDYVPMAPDAAIIFIVFGLILFFRLYNSNHRYIKTITISFVSLFSIYGLLKFIEYFIGFDLTFGNFFFPITEKLGNFPLGRMSPITGLLFFITGISVLLKFLGKENLKFLNIVSFLGVMVTFSGFTAVLGYLFGSPFLYGGSVIPLALSTSFAFLFLGCGVIAIAGTETYFLGLFTGSSASARLLRVILPLYIFTAILSDFLNIRIDDAYFHNSALFSSVKVLFTIILTSIVVIYLANSIFKSADKAEKERRKADEALRQSEEQYRTLFEKAGDGIFILSTKGEIKGVNESFAQMHGYSKEEMLTMNLHDLDTSETAKSIPERMKKVMNSETFTFEVAHYHKNGNIIFLEVNSCLIKIGKEDYFLSFHRDITARRKAEEALLQSEERFRQAVLEAPFPIMIHADDGQVLSISRAWTEVTGYSHYDIPTTSAWSSLAYGKEHESVKAYIDTLYHLKRRVDEGEYTVKTKTGELRIWDFSSAPLGELSDGKRLVISMAKDISERKRVEIELFEKEVQYRNLADAGLALIWTAGTDKLCNYFNQTWLNFTGRTLEQELGNGWAEGVHPADFDRCLQTYITAFDKRESFEMEYRLRHASGEYLWLQDLGTPNYNSSGKFIGYIGHCFDISDRKQKEEEIKKLNEDLKQRADELEAINKDLESFSYTVSHDLKNPLNIIKNYSKFLATEYSDKLDDQGKNYIKTIIRSVSRMGGIIEAILKLSKITKSEIHCIGVNLSILAESIAGDFQNLESKRNVEFIIAPDIVVKADEGLIKTLLENLISNAWKYSKKTDKAVIEFGMTQIEDKTTYFVKDNGVGFDMKYSDKLFAPFKRLHNESEFEGTGIGLATVQRIINRHGGKVWAEGKVGEGATFYFTLE